MPPCPPSAVPEPDPAARPTPVPPRPGTPARATRPSGASRSARATRTGRAAHPSSSVGPGGEAPHGARSGPRPAHRALRAVPAGVRWRPELGDGLEMDVTARGRAVQLHLVGDLDVASVGRFAAAMAWLRRTGRMVIVDTRRLHFVGMAGERALHDAAGYDELGRPDPQVVVLVGPAVARFRALLARVTATADGPPGPFPALP